MDSTFDPPDTDDPFAAMCALLALLPPDVRANMVTMYTEALAVQMEQLGAAVAGSDDAVMRDLAHKAAGSAGMMQNALLSRAAVYVLQPLTDDDLRRIVTIMDPAGDDDR